MRERGLEVVTAEAVRAGARPEAVVVGLAREALVYEALAMACLLLRQGAHFIATNNDPTFPSEIGLLPGAGAVVSFLETASDRQPVVIGKPHRYLFEEALERLGSVASATAMVGDRLATDIAGGRAAGLRTVLVLSGVSSLDGPRGERDPAGSCFRGHSRPHHRPRRTLVGGLGGGLAVSPEDRPAAPP